MLKPGARLQVGHYEVFPDGCLYVPGSIGASEDYDEKTRIRTPALDKITSQRVWQVRVMDLDPELGTRSREVAVKILADVQPVPPSAEACLIEFVGLVVTPYVAEKTGRLTWSFRATGMRAPAAAGKRTTGDDKAA